MIVFLCDKSSMVEEKCFLLCFERIFSFINYFGDFREKTAENVENCSLKYNEISPRVEIILNLFQNNLKICTKVK
jgi:hypothetical protein